MCPTCTAALLRETVQKTLVVITRSCIVVRSQNPFQNYARDCPFWWFLACHLTMLWSLTGDTAYIKLSTLAVHSHDAAVAVPGLHARAWCIAMLLLAGRLLSRPAGHICDMLLHMQGLGQRS